MLIDNNIFVEFKGAFTEQYVLQQMKAYNKHPYYWSNVRTPAEIDLIHLFFIHTQQSLKLRSRYKVPTQLYSCVGKKIYKKQMPFRI